MSEKENAPSDPSDPSDPSAPVAESADPADPAGPPEPPEPVEAVEVVEVVEAVEPSGPQSPELTELIEPTEPTELTESPESPESPESTESADSSAGIVAEPVRRGWSRGRIAAAGGALVLAGALVAGTGYTVVTVRDADRDAGAPVWEFPTQAPSSKEPKEAEGDRTGLAAMLVPYGTDGLTRGPDIGEFGSDAQLDGDRAVALRKESLKDLPRSQRKSLEKEIDKQRIEGIAMRSYLSEEAMAGSDNEGVYTVSIQLSRMGNKAAVRDIATSYSDFLAAMDIFRKGPAIEGHKNAKCFLPPRDDDFGLEGMYCSAYVGEVLVTLIAEAAKPLDTEGVAMLLREQLDRIAEPGKAV
ncbi:hypothetical protein [Streptomyces sp. NPDC059894]|uniref:hypothetical protein n=1 Tax=unclassified Streptomyces TaxID=2593676 RepID=UPI003666D728